jgi:GWxTD domain-containing protein
MKYFIYLIFILFVIALITSSCTHSLISDSTSSRRPYDYESTSLHAEVIPFFYSDTLSVFLKVAREELLYTREFDMAPFIANLEITLNSQKWIIRDTLSSNSPRLIRQRFDLKNTNELDLSWLKYTVNDLNRNSSISAMEEVKKVIAWNTQENWPIDNGFISVGSQILIISDFNTEWDVKHVIPENKLPAPPFSNYRNPLDTIKAKPHSSINNSWTVLEGCQVFTSTDQEINLVIHGMSAEFPVLKSILHLIESARYIATRSEFSVLLNASNPKKALDEFWLSCGKSPEKARKLIKTYYSRVEEANLSFSGLQEGWRTDRGMIHIIYGVPNRIRRDYWAEVWTYGEDGTSNTLTFRFRRTIHDLDNNRFRLERNMTYRSSWDRMVTSWRNGRVQLD